MLYHKRPTKDPRGASDEGAPLVFIKNYKQSLKIKGHGITSERTYQNRVGQHTSWDQRKRLTTLRGRLADCVIIGDEDEAKGIHKALAKTHRRIERGINLGLEISALRERVKAETGITDEKVNPKDDE